MILIQELTLEEESRIEFKKTFLSSAQFNEDTINDNDDMLIAFYSQNEQINNTFYHHKWQYKFSNSRNQRSIIDYLITNKQLYVKY